LPEWCLWEIARLLVWQRRQVYVTCSFFTHSLCTGMCLVCWYTLGLDGLFVLRQGLTCSPGWSKLRILLPQPPKCWAYRCAPPHPASFQFLFFFFFSFFPYWGLNLGPTPPALFGNGFFWDRDSRTIYPGWLQTIILSVAASWVASITGVSHQHRSFFLSLSLSLPLPPSLSFFWDRDVLCSSGWDYRLQVSTTPPNSACFADVLISLVFKFYLKSLLSLVAKDTVSNPMEI
jgi:hypothetical protein